MANVQSAAFIRLMALAHRRGVEVNLSQLFRALDLTEEMPVLERIEVTMRTLQGFGLGIIPAISTGDFDSARVMRTLEIGSTPIESITADIAGGETETVEFKSSYLFDHKQARARPEIPVAQLSSVAVMHSALKTICAFANTRGGTLLIGVEDDGNGIGIEADYKICAASGEGAKDKWQLRLRTDIEAQFKDGKALNDFVTVEFAELNHGATIARIAVLPRKRLTFLKKASGIWVPYRRQGNRSSEIPYEDIEDFLSKRFQEE